MCVGAHLSQHMELRQQALEDSLLMWIPATGLWFPALVAITLTGCLSFLSVWLNTMTKETHNESI